MKSLIYAGAAAIAFSASIAAPAVAQDGGPTASKGGVYVLTEMQQADYDSWPEERQVTYTAWPYDYQEYYWTLEPVRQDGWWLLTDDQRGQLYALPMTSRDAAWLGIVEQMNSTPATTVSATTPDMQYVSGEVAQTTPASTAPANGEYPICQGDESDNCINPREAGKDYGNVPLNYWPGKPASQIDEPLPANKPS